MPNWVENELTVTGEKNSIKDFKEFAREEDDKLLSANKFIPYPKHFKEMDKLAKKVNEQRDEFLTSLKESCSEEEAGKKAWEKFPHFQDGYNSGGYEWCIKNWGTKWGFCDVELVKKEETLLLYHFDTAWSSPSPLIKRMGKLFPQLNFKLQYYEGGMGFAGTIVIEDGKIVTDSAYDYSGQRGG